MAEFPSDDPTGTHLSKLHAGPHDRPVARPRGRGPLLTGIAFAEWTKLRTLRSSYWVAWGR